MMSRGTHFQRKVGALSWVGPVLALFCAGASADTSQTAEAFINAPVAEVWSVFTTSEGFRKLGVAQAEVDLRIGGEIRTHYKPDGKLGDAESIVNEILAFEPERMLAIRAKQAPASFPHRDALAGTWSVIYFTSAGEGMTHVRIVGLGYNETPSSQAVRKFFADGNRWTLDHLAKQYWPSCPRCKNEAANE